jgi:HD-GYP domain-containing protein (c-di-GMP phosphodiesterase class II)
VTGIAVDFGLSLGLAKPDIERLYSAAMFHDIGKAKIPLAVLDKPGRLDAAERALIETHPVAGFDLLKGTCGISAEILDAAGTIMNISTEADIPMPLCGDNIADIVRVLTISDVFAALIEDRLNNLSERIRESASCRQENCAKSNENLLFDREQNEPQPRIWQNEPNEILQQNPRV